MYAIMDLDITVPRDPRACKNMHHQHFQRRFGEHTCTISPNSNVCTILNRGISYCSQHSWRTEDYPYSSRFLHVYFHFSCAWATARFYTILHLDLRFAISISFVAFQFVTSIWTLYT